MKIRKIEMMRLYAVSETPNENGLYDLIPFGINEDSLYDLVTSDIKTAYFDQQFEHEKLDDVLCALVDYHYGGGKFIKIDSTVDYTCSGVMCVEGYIYIKAGRELIAVPDVLDKINADPDISTIYLLVNRKLTEGAWIVAENLAS